MSISAAEHLERLAAGARENAREVEAVVRGLDEEALMWRPEPGRWGVADCLEHLVATAAAYHPRVRAAIDAAPASGPAAVYKPRLFGRLFIRLSGPDAPVRLRARGPFVPPRTRPDAPERFAARQDELLGLIADASGADLQAARVTSPLSRLLALTLGECLEMLVAHQRRHLGQARRVRAEPGFPDPSA